jgi:hypothetical protein
MRNRKRGNNKRLKLNWRKRHLRKKIKTTTLLKIVMIVQMMEISI